MAGTWPGGWITGFCAIKHCEGTKPRGILTGTPMQTCVAADQCACKCHVEVRKMFEMVGMVHVVQQNPEYQPVKQTWWMPTPEERLALRATSTAPERQPTVMPSIMPDILPPTIVTPPPLTPSASGRRTKGSLEEEVQKVTDLWAALGMPQIVCSPAWIAEKIDAENPPSTGAISAVFDRWQEYGFAVIDKKPTRFSGYTSEGVQHGLLSMKARYKEAKRRQSAAMSRR